MITPTHYIKLNEIEGRTGQGIYSSLENKSILDETDPIKMTKWCQNELRFQTP